MNSLKNIYDNLTNYSYYHEIEKYSSSKEYIQRYFKQGYKEVIANFLDEISIPDFRYDHMKSTYMLGVWLYDNCGGLQESINYELNGADEPLRNEFLYRWYLTCLFHDVGYCFENGVIKPTKDICELSGKIKNGLVGYKDLFSTSCKIPLKLRKSALAYYKNKLEENPCHINHGIGSAVLLYDRLKPLHEEERVSDGLKFGPKIFKFSLIPVIWYIIAHNIWTATEKTDNAEKYRKNGLENLVQTIGKSLIDFKKHGMLFLLCFVDTIEPIKLLNKKDANLTFDQCLECVTMKVASNTISIGFNSSVLKDKSCLGNKFSDYYLAAIVYNLNFLINHDFKIGTGNKEIVCQFV